MRKGAADPAKETEWAGSIVSAPSAGSGTAVLGRNRVLRKGTLFLCIRCK
ncbi:hypothetical protein Cdeb_01006 [Caldibacillus debilis GB1]|jgi:hypothetical protein|uniref:Uncharacterized protein n=1 Tax=Caldibacillus debilis GB1 TaxID=1339248 RepID=A0A420VFG7_9BACI|nr:hypothetical protein Cdeb_01006 [Caldibacillus debilis GB1]